MLTVGSTVEVVNVDPTVHNVHTYALKNRGLNRNLPPGARETFRLDRQERIAVKCDVHPWMAAWIVVVDTPFYSATAPDGSFEIRGLQPGRYSVSLWHEKLGKLELQVEVSPGVNQVEWKMALQAKRRKGRR